MNRRDLSSRRGVCLAILGAVFLLTFLFLYAEIWLLRIPASRDYGEGHILWLTRQILDLSKAYGPMDAPPYVAFPYTPLYLLTARLVNVFVGDLFTAGRVLSLLSTLGIGVAVGATVLFSIPARAPAAWRWASAGFAGVLPLLSDNVARWGALMRVDMLGLLLMYAGMGVYIVLGRRERWQHLAAALFVLALFTKQTMLSAPLACLILGLLVDTRRTIRVFAGGVALILAGAWYLNTVTHGGFLRHVIGYNINPFSWATALRSIYIHVRNSLPAVAIAAAAFLGIWSPVALRKRGWMRVLQFRSASPYGQAVIVSGLNCVFATGAMLSVGKMGANYNHTLAWDVSTGPLCGLFLYRVLATWTPYWRSAKAAALASALLMASLLLPAEPLLGALLHSSAVRDQIRGDAEMVDLIRQTPGPVFSENLLLLSQAGKVVEAEPATLTYLALAGRWDERPYVRLFDQHYFSLIVANDIHDDDHYNPAVTAALQRAYVLERHLGGYSIYRPRPGSAQLR
jgi:hypothetical protein